MIASILTPVWYQIEGDSFDSSRWFLLKKYRSLCIRICHGLKVSPYRRYGLHRHHLCVWLESFPATPPRTWVIGSGMGCLWAELSVELRWQACKTEECPHPQAHKLGSPPPTHHYYCCQSSRFLSQPVS